MTKQEKILSVLLIFSFCKAVTAESYCQTQIEQYQKNNFFFHTRQARAEHIYDLIKRSQNKFKLINDIYLHYRSIDDTSSELSRSLELCLVNLLKLSAQEKRSRIGISRPSKLQDPVHEVIAEQVVNQAYLKVNQEALRQLVALDKLETSILHNAQVKKSDFDKALPPERELDFGLRLLAAYQAVMAVDNFGHAFLSKFNLMQVQIFSDVLGDFSSAEGLLAAMASYEAQPSALSYDQIRVEVRSIYQEVRGVTMPLSPSEVLRNLLNACEEVRLTLGSRAKKEALSFGEQVRVKRAVAITNKIENAQRNLERFITLSHMNKFIRAYQAVEEFSPSGLGWTWGAVDSQSFLIRAKDFRSLITGPDALMTQLDAETLDFRPTRQKIASVKTAAKALYEEVILLYEEYESHRKLSNNNTQALVANLKELQNYADNSDEIIREKMAKITSNRDLGTMEQVKFLAEDFIEALSDRADDVREKIEAVFADS